jgi:hypothetical protein
LGESVQVAGNQAVGGKDNDAVIVKPTFLDAAFRCRLADADSLRCISFKCVGDFEKFGSGIGKAGEVGDGCRTGAASARAEAQAEITACQFDCSLSASFRGLFFVK